MHISVYAEAFGKQAQGIPADKHLVCSGVQPPPPPSPGSVTWQQSPWGVGGTVVPRGYGKGAEETNTFAQL